MANSQKKQTRRLQGRQACKSHYQRTNRTRAFWIERRCRPNCWRYSCHREAIGGSGSEHEANEAWLVTWERAVNYSILKRRAEIFPLGHSLFQLRPVIGEI